MKGSAAMACVTPRISVIMPVYNAAPYLRRALNSVCGQTFTDLEILCVNDGSTDGSPAILAEYAAKDPRVRVVPHENNLGYASAMNSGFAAVRGETIGIVDADDVISKNFFAELWSAYENGAVDIAKGRRLEQETDGKWRETKLNARIKEDALNFTWQWTTAIYRASLIREYGLRLSTELTTGQDTLFLHQLMGYEPRIGLSDKAIYYYLRNDASMTKSRPDEFYLASNIMNMRLLKNSLSQYRDVRQRRKLFVAIVKFLYSTASGRFMRCDWSVHLPVVKAILSDDEHYASLKDFPFLRQALRAESVHELKDALKIAAMCLDAQSLREKVRRKTA